MEKTDLIGKNISRLSRQYGRRFDVALEKYGISQIQMRIMGFLYMREDQGDIFQKDLQREFNIRASSVSSVICTMEENGYIVRESVPCDARLKRIILTEKAKCLQSEMIGAIHHVEEELAAFLSEEEQKTLISLLTKLSKAIEAGSKES